MMDLKLPKLPDRTPVKLTIAISPDLAEALASYSQAYEAAYSQRETVQDLIPFMLVSFLESDRAFTKGRKATPARKGKPGEAGQR